MCHSGTFQKEHELQAIGMPQVRPDKRDGHSFSEDFERL